MREDLRADGGILNVAGNVSTGDRASGFSDGFVAAREVAAIGGIDNVANGRVREPADLCKHFLGDIRGLSIDDKHTVLADLNGYIAAIRTNDHENPRHDRQHVNVVDLQGIDGTGGARMCRSGPSLIARIHRLPAAACGVVR